jgi:hypothetical protein
VRPIQKVLRAWFISPAPAPEPHLDGDHTLPRGLTSTRTAGTYSQETDLKRTKEATVQSEISILSMVIKETISTNWVSSHTNALLLAEIICTIHPTFQPPKPQILSMQSPFCKENSKFTVPHLLASSIPTPLLRAHTELLIAQRRQGEEMKRRRSIINLLRP